MHRILSGTAKLGALGFVGVGAYSQCKHENQHILGTIAQAFWWSAMENVGAAAGTTIHDIPSVLDGTARDFPVRAAQLNAQTLDACLRESGVLADPATTVESCEWEHFGDGAGFLGAMYRVKVGYAGPGSSDPALPAQMVAKFSPGDAQMRMLGRLVDAQQIEAEVYNKGVPASAGLPAPACYFAAADPITDASLMLMEDLSVRGWSVCDQAEGLSVEQAAAVMRLAARLHARYWGRVRASGLAIQRLDYWKGVDIAGLLEPGIKGFEAWWRAFAAAHPTSSDGYPLGGLLSPAFAAVAREYAQRLKRLTRLDNISSELGGPWESTVVHGDLRAENVFFSDGGKGAEVTAVIDFQLCKEHHALYDVAYLLQGSMDAKLRREHELVLLHTYYAALLAAAAECGNGAMLNAERYPWERFVLDYQLQTALAFLTITTSLKDLHAKAAALPAGPGRDHGLAVVERWSQRGLASVADAHEASGWRNYAMMMGVYDGAWDDAAGGGDASTVRVTDAQLEEAYEHLPAYLLERPPGFGARQAKK